MTQKTEKLLSVLKGHRVFIQTHNYPDPDAISSAYGLQQFLLNFGINALICYKGNIAKASTTKMLEKFGITIFDLDIFTEMTEDDMVITVDAQPGIANITETKGTVAGCIDHHPTTVPYECQFKDIIICGSCATIIADYFFKNDIVPSTNIATSLMYGLKMDTENLTRGVTELDAKIYYQLFPFSDQETLKTLTNQQMEFSELDSYIKAISSVKIYDGIGFSYINKEVSDGLIASIGDFILKLTEVEFAIAYCKKGDGLKFSVRSEIYYLDAGTITQNALDGIGTGGGHSTMAGGYMPFKNIENADFDLEEEITNRFINAVYFCRMINDALADPFADLKTTP